MNVPLHVRDYMITDLVTVRPETEIMRVVDTLIENDVSGVLVIDASDALVGILTERDCIEIATQSGYFDEHGGPVSEYMTTDIETVQPDDNLMDVAVRMARSRYRRFPVVDNGKLVGLIGRRDVMRVLGRGSWFGSSPG